LRRQAVSKPALATMRQIGKESQVALLTANTRDLLYVFSKDGRCSRLGIHEIPEEGGKKVSDLTGFSGRDAITAAITLPRERAGDDGGYLFLVTDQGTVKRVATVDVQSNTGSEFPVMNVEEKERLQWVLPTRGSQEVILVSAQGQSIRFSAEDVRSMGLAAGGVGGMKLHKKDRIIYAGVVDPDGELLTITAAGFGKRSPLAEYSVQGRNGGGIVTHKITDKTGEVVAALVLPPKAENAWLVFVTGRGQAKAALTVEVPAMGRSVLGKVVVEASPQDGIATIWRPDAGPHSAEEPPVDPAPPATTPKRAPPAAPQKPVTAPLLLKTAPPVPAKPPAPVKTTEKPAASAVQKPEAPVAPAKTTPAAATGDKATPKARSAAASSAAPAKTASETRNPATAPEAAPAATPAQPADAAPLAFDFIDDVAKGPPTKPAASKSKLSAVVSVPNAQANAAKKPKT
jgi:DNA gyrase subunit A